MAVCNLSFVKVILFLCGVGLVAGQEGSSCYGGGSIAASVIITIIVVLLLGGLAYFGWKRYGKFKKGKHLILETDPEKGTDDYAFDNPGFKDAGLTPIGKALEKSKIDSGKLKWTQWSPLGALTNKSEKRKTVDDSAIDEDTLKVVSLRSHDFTGLGFNICGNMRDGIFIKDILHRGPASESGKLNPGDRINSITISFEHIVYEDALTILSYASPYEVIIEARNGKLNSAHAAQSGQPGHPLYKSSSSTDLLQIGKSAKKRLFQADELNDSLSSNYSSLQKTRSTATTLERSEQESPKQKQNSKKPPSKTQLNPDQLKSQLEQKILEDHNENLKNKQNYDNSLKLEVAETQKTENKYQKFGIKVLPMEQNQQKSPKSAELSQNDNNINIERHVDSTLSIAVPAGIDEVDIIPPPVKKREKKVAEPETIQADVSPEPFVRKGSLNSSGIKRDENGIPQEIPNHMLNAAVAARRNRKTSEDRNLDKDDPRSPKKPKGKAPAPPPEGLRSSTENLNESLPSQLNFTNNLDEIYPADEHRDQAKPVKSSSEAQPASKDGQSEFKDYNSDSDIETDNQSSVNTIELNASDITIHQTEETEEKQNRKTASTGDLTKIQKTRKTSTGTLERAQSLDITDSGMPVLTKKRKGGKLEDNFDSRTSSDESLYGKALINKEPRLSLILDGLNTFQRSRLKKSTEWGNLEDAILNLNKSDSSDSFGKENSNESFDFKVSSENFDKNFDFGTKSPELDALVNKIKEIKKETSQAVGEVENGGVDKIESTLDWLESKKSVGNDTKTIKNEIWPAKLSPEGMHQPSTISINMEDVSNQSHANILQNTSKLVSETTEPVKIEMRKVKNEIWPSRLSSDESKIAVSSIGKELPVNKQLIEPSPEKPDDFPKLNIMDRVKLKSFDDKLQPNVTKVQNEIWPNILTEEGASRTLPLSSVEAPGNPTIESKEKEKIIEFAKGTETQGKIKNEIWPTNLSSSEHNFTTLSIGTDSGSDKLDFKKPSVYPKSEISKPDDEIITILNTNMDRHSKQDNSFETGASKAIRNFGDRKALEKNETVEVRNRNDVVMPKVNAQLKKIDVNVLDTSKNFLEAEREASTKHLYSVMHKLDDTNVSDDIKVSRHSLGSLERPKFSGTASKPPELSLDKHNISNITVSDRYIENSMRNSAPAYDISFNRSLNTSKEPNVSELYTTALDETLKHDDEKSRKKTNFETIIVTTPDLIKNVSLAEAIHELNNEVTVEGPTSLTFEIPGKALEAAESQLIKKILPLGLHCDDAPAKNLSNGSIKDRNSSPDSSRSNSSLTYVTEIQVLTPNVSAGTNVSEVEILPSAGPAKTKNLDSEFENYVRNFESSVKTFENVQNREPSAEALARHEMKSAKSIVVNEKMDPEKELHKIQEIAEEQLKKLPEMRFSTSSYEPSKIPEKRQSQIELLRSNFEKSPPKAPKPEAPIKSRIPIATTAKTPPTSPERRDSRNLDFEMDKEIIEIMSSGIHSHSTPIASSLKYQPKTANRNVTVTSIRNSKIPSGLPTYSSRPPVPPRKSESLDGGSVIQLSTNGNTDNSFKQWVFNPNENSITNITVTENKPEK